MAKSYLELLKQHLRQLELEMAIPEQYIQKLRTKITALESVESKYEEPDRGGYNLEWAKKMGDLEAEMTFYHFLFNDKKLAKLLKIIAKREYEPVTEPEDEIKELVIYSYVSASREYELFRLEMEDLSERERRPFFERDVFDEYFVKRFYDNLFEYSFDVLKYKWPGIVFKESDLKEAVDLFKSKYSAFEFVGGVK